MYSMSGNCLMSRMRRIDLHDTILSRDFRGCFTVFIGKAAANRRGTLSQAVEMNSFMRSLMNVERNQQRL